MNRIELAAIRRFLFFSQKEAAELVGNVSLQDWQACENGAAEVPEKIESAAVY